MHVLHVAARAAELTLAASFLVLAVPSLPAGAESPAAQTPAGPAQDARSRALALVYGLDGTKVDVAAGIALLEAASAQGDVKAGAELGRMLLDGQVLPADPARGIALLERAVAAGDPEAMTALGGALLWGRAVPADPARARALLDQAVAAGDPEARDLLGEQLVGGWVLPRDVAQGQALLEAGVAAGDVKAETALSGLYLYGTGVAKDPQKARALAEAAAAKGNGKALRQIGEMQMWSERDPAGAEALLRRAGGLGDGASWAILAEGAMYGYLGGGSVSRAKFDDVAARARAAGNERIEVLDATRQMWGISMPASGPKTIERLVAAADAGNGTAARFLVALLRDGNHMNVWPDRDAAAAAIKRYGALIGADDDWRLEQTVAAARAHRPKGWAALAGALEARPELASKDFGQDLYRANPNAMVYVLQRRLAASGLYRGPLDGLAGHGTLRALHAACTRLSEDPGCGDSVLRPDVLGAIFAARK